MPRNLVLFPKNGSQADEILFLLSKTEMLPICFHRENFDSARRMPKDDDSSTKKIDNAGVSFIS